MNFSRRDASVALGLALVFFGLLLPTLGLSRLLGLDEGIYALVAKAEALDGHWMPFAWGSGAFMEKPPLFLWLMGLSLKLFGPTEFAVRLPSLLFGAACAAYVYAFGCRLFPSRLTAGLAAALLVLQDHFILYSRLGTMDMALSAAYLGTLWHYAAALEPGEARPRSQMLLAGLWFAAAVLIKSWFAFLLLPALLLPKPAGISRARLFGPALLALLFWLGLYSAEFGAAFWRYEIFRNLWLRIGGGAVRSGLAGASPWGTLQFYLALIQEGLPWLWPLSVIGLGRLGLEARQEGLGRPWLLLLIFGLGYAGALVFFSAPLINYATPLVPLAALLGAGALRSQGRQLRWLGPAFCALLAWRLAGYVQHPPDPNRAVVEAVIAHPARFEGEPLLYAGEHTDARALEFYSRYRVLSVDGLPKLRPAQALLVPGPQGPLFYPALSGTRPLTVAEELAIPFAHPDPNRPVPSN